VRYLVVQTTKEIGGRAVPVSTDWIDSVSWVNADLELNIPPDEIANAPVVDRPHTMTRADEDRLHIHYRRPRYWPS
jgi:hypothetical protein